VWPSVVRRFSYILSIYVPWHYRDRQLPWYFLINGSKIVWQLKSQMYVVVVIELLMNPSNISDLSRENECDSSLACHVRILVVCVFQDLVWYREMRQIGPRNNIYKSSNHIFLSRAMTPHFLIELAFMEHVRHTLRHLVLGKLIILSSQHWDVIRGHVGPKRRVSGVLYVDSILRSTVCRLLAGVYRT